ncbi:MAG: anaerobic ribonucleoside-triphosphate reductase activating protein [Nanoarchaeota archaeon]|nr:anaerobic ribonucleoside-triphosphate reductase activating protein [Nanoarchaeota archaeon]
MRISQFLKQSFIDYPGNISSVIFTSGCNYKCPSCHAKHIIYRNERIDEKEFFSYINPRKGWIEAVVLCGGEPTIQEGLRDFARKIKDLGFKVKLDTNGSNPKVLEKLLKENLLDYAAMDVKGPKDMYNQLAGVEVNTISLEKSMALIQQFPDYEFRTTIVPIIRDDKKTEISFMSVQEAEGIARWIVQTTNNNKHKYFLQKFVARGKEMIDEHLSKENLSKEMQQTPESLILEMKKAVKKYLPNCDIR